MGGSSVTDKLKGSNVKYIVNSFLCLLLLCATSYLLLIFNKLEGLNNTDLIIIILAFINLVLKWIELCMNISKKILKDNI